MIQFRKLLDSNMKPISGNKIQECDEHWCTVFNKEELEDYDWLILLTLIKLLNCC
jgi:hypothetical protein